MSGTGNDAFNTTRIGPSQILFSFNTSNNTATNFQCRTFENCGNNTVVAKLRIDVLKVSDLVVFETSPWKPILIFFMREMRRLQSHRGSMIT